VEFLFFGDEEIDISFSNLKKVSNKNVKHAVKANDT
jgi:hypothetical protein